jgi:hypothetical protein
MSCPEKFDCRANGEAGLSRKELKLNFDSFIAMRACESNFFFRKAEPSQSLILENTGSF